MMCGVIRYNIILFMTLLESASLRVGMLVEVTLPTFRSPQTPIKWDLLLLYFLWCGILNDKAT